MISFTDRPTSTQYHSVNSPTWLSRSEYFSVRGEHRIVHKLLSIGELSISREGRRDVGGCEEILFVNEPTVISP